MLKLLSVLVLVLTFGVGNVWGSIYTYYLNSAASAASSGSNVNYWYTAENCTTRCVTGNSNIISNNNGAATIYYKYSTETATAFTIDAKTSAYFINVNNSATAALLIGKTNSTMTLPTFSGEKITNVTIKTSSQCSTSVQFGVYSGENRADGSNADRTGATSTDFSFDIDDDYQTTALTININSNHNLQISQITITTAASNCTMTYNANGATSGDVPTDASSPYAPSSTVTVLGNTGNLERTGCTFAGWNTAADGSGTNYAADATFSISANTTLYAKWTATVTWKANNQIVKTDNIVVPADGKEVALPTTEQIGSNKCGDRIMGWTESETHKANTAPADLFTAAPTVQGSKTYYAVFADYAPIVP